MSGQDFTCAFSSGVTQTTWLDPLRPSDSMPSRLNPHVGRPHLRWMGEVGAEVEITATVGGVAGEVDANLGGRLFTAWLIESPAPGPLPWTSAGGVSSIQAFTPPTIGHYSIGFARASGGTVILHLDVEAP